MICTSSFKQMDWYCTTTNVQ